MDFEDINRAIKQVIDFDDEKELYKFLKNQIPHIILNYNKEQLFIDSVGADGLVLGFYSSDAKGLFNEPYTMVNEGVFINSIKIEIKYRKIKIFSDDPKLNDMLKSKYYNTHEFFGLTDKNFKKLQSKWIIPFLKTKLDPSFIR